MPAVAARSCSAKAQDRETNGIGRISRNPHPSYPHRDYHNRADSKKWYKSKNSRPPLLPKLPPTTIGKVIMLHISHATRIFVCSQPVDFRKGIDGLAAVCRNKLDADPLSGTLFLFQNRSRSSIRILIYDGQGLWLCTKRLSQGTFRWWPKDHIAARALYILLWNGNPELAGFAKDWKKVCL